MRASGLWGVPMGRSNSPYSYSDFTRIAGLRDQGPARLAAATELRMRAFTTMVSTYEEVRHAVFYLRRREDDADSIAQSLYAGKARRKVVQPPPEVPSAQTTSGV